MSLLEGTNVRAEVWPSSIGSDEFGATVLIPGAKGDPPAPHVVYGSFVRPSATVDAVLGYDTDQGSVFMTRQFPWEARTLLVIEGESWDVVGPAVTRGYSVGTKHALVPLAARGRAPAAAPSPAAPNL